MFGKCRPPTQLTCGFFGYGQRIFKFDAKVSYSAVELCVPEQKLNRFDNSSFAASLRCFGPAQRVSAVSSWFQSNCSLSPPYKPGILACWGTLAVVKRAWKYELTPDHFRRIDPRDNGIPCDIRKFEVSGPLGFVVDHSHRVTNSIV